VIRSAYRAQVPAGQALAGDREKFSQEISDGLRRFHDFTIVHEEVMDLPSEEEAAAQNQYWIVASGPLTTEPLAQAVRRHAKEEAESLYFYDAIAPILDSDSINFDEGYWANRWDKGETKDYFNIPLDKETYLSLHQDILDAEKTPLHDFESPKYFESCLPIEVLGDRGVDTLRFGPLKPVGLTDPKTGRFPYAAIQLRKENKDGTMLSMVGFQTKMKWPEQKRVFSKLPCFSNLEFFRYGSVHRNTYLNCPKILNPDLSLKSHGRLFLAGQMTGVEGYTESAAIGLAVGRACSAKVKGHEFPLPGSASVLGALVRYIVYGSQGEFQPMNAHFGLLPTIQRKRGVSKQDVKTMKCQRAQTEIEKWHSAFQ
jgi:methylenetetrahydrofolate--tRNA-(uracil-5-)-methyltransferase